MSSSGIFFPGFTTVGILKQIQKDLKSRVHLEFRKSKWSRKEVSEKTLVIPRSWNEETWGGRTLTSQKEDGTSKANQMIAQFQQNGHPVFRGASALDRGTLKRKSGRNTVHFTAESGNIELMLRTIHSANEVSICGAASTWCVDLAEKMHDQTNGSGQTHFRI